MKYKKWLDEWLANYVAPAVKAKTYERYSQVVNRHLKPKFGECEPDDLQPIVLQHFVTELLQNGNHRTHGGLSETSVNGIITVIQSSLKTAYNLGICKSYNADKIMRPKCRESEVKCFTVQEQKMLENAVRRDKKPKTRGILICLYTGLRIGELLALQWRDIDFSEGTLSVNKTCHDGKNKDGVYCRITDTPKTNSSKRIIPLPKQIIPILRDMKKKGTCEYVIENAGKPVSVRSYQRSFELLLKKNKIRHKGFHALRHTFATRALECGMDVKTLSEILGHKNPTVTLTRYVHSMTEHKRYMMNKVGKLFV